MSVRVLVVDDSAFMRKVISEILNEQEGIEVVATARNGQDALDKLGTIDIDLITLDVEMPVMDGIDTLQRIMAENPRPVIMLSSVTKKGSETTMKALSLGAVDFVPKPSGSISLDLKESSRLIVDKVRWAAQAQVRKTTTPLKGQGRERFAYPTSEPKARVTPSSGRLSRCVVAIGSSTGGPKAVEEVFARIPATIQAGILVVQHMPRGFTKSFADRLNNLFPLDVKEAETGDQIEDGKALIAPGGFHMTVGLDKRILLNQDPPVQFLRPSIDVTFESLPKVFGNSILTVILTGMGRDGAKGVAIIKSRGGISIAQDKTTSTIYSMPRIVFEEGNADYVLPLERIGESITKIVATM